MAPWLVGSFTILLMLCDLSFVEARKWGQGGKRRESKQALTLWCISSYEDSNMDHVPPL